MYSVINLFGLKTCEYGWICSKEQVFEISTAIKL